MTQEFVAWTPGQKSFPAMVASEKGNMKKTFVVLSILLAAGLSSSIFGSTVVLGPSNAANGPVRVRPSCNVIV